MYRWDLSAAYSQDPYILAKGLPIDIVYYLFTFFFLPTVCYSVCHLIGNQKREHSVPDLRPLGVKGKKNMSADNIQAICSVLRR